MFTFSKNSMDDDIKGYTNKDGPLDDSKITVSKRVRSLRQLTRIEKEIVKLCKEGERQH